MCDQFQPFIKLNLSQLESGQLPSIKPSISLMEEAMMSDEPDQDLIIKCSLTSNESIGFMINLPESWDTNKIKRFCSDHVVNFSEVVSIETI